MLQQFIMGTAENQSVIAFEAASPRACLGSSGKITLRIISVKSGSILVVASSNYGTWKFVINSILIIIIGGLALSHSFTWSHSCKVFFHFLPLPFILLERQHWLFSVQMSYEVRTVATAPIQGQKTGTSGLRKRVKVVLYLLQCAFI